MPRLIPQLDGSVGMRGCDEGERGERGWLDILAPAVKLMLIPCTGIEPLDAKRTSYVAFSYVAIFLPSTFELSRGDASVLRKLAISFGGSRFRDVTDREI